MLFKDRESTYLPILARAFAAKGLPPELGPALARQESGFIPTIENLGPGDKERGGSYGLCQMSLQTAKSLGYTGDVAGLKDPLINAALAADLCHQNRLRPDCRAIRDVIAMYNSGKPYDRAPRVTAMTYVVNVLKYMAIYKDQCSQFVNPESGK